MRRRSWVGKLEAMAMVKKKLEMSDRVHTCCRPRQKFVSPVAMVSPRSTSMLCDCWCFAVSYKLASVVVDKQEDDTGVAIVTAVSYR